MRVTDSTLYAQIRAGLAARRESFERAQLAAITGRRVVKPSDDPAATSQARNHSAQEAKATSHERSVNVALTALQVADAALDQIGESFTRARELALQASTGTLSDQDRVNLGNEVEALRSQVLSLANTESGGRYIFGGLQDGSAPFGADGSYNGDSQAQQIEVGKGLRVATGIAGDRVFGTAGGGQDAFAALTELRDALASNQPDAVRGTIERIAQAQTQVQSARSEVGGNIDTATVSLSVAQRVRDQAVTARASLLDADPLNSFSDLQRAQGALEAAVSVASQLPAQGLASRARLG
jgi:flagellar hook-associated protein 3 FlgL